MLIYRFRVTCDESDNFLMEVEIMPNQTFLDFHHIIVDTVELLHCDKASFFMTDRKFIKDREISLKAEKKQVRKYDEDIDQVITEYVALPLMKSEKLKDYIEDPHQKLIYEFTGRDHYTFHIELFKIFKIDEIESFPRCIKKSGELPKLAIVPAPIAEKAPVQKKPEPKISLPALDTLTRLDNLVENEEELAAIEDELQDLMLEVDDSMEPESGTSAGPEDEFSLDQDDDLLNDEHLEHIDDFEDLDNLDTRMSGYGREQDDY